MSASTMNRLAAILVALAVVVVGAAALFRLAQQSKFELKRLEVRGDLRHVTATSVRTAVAAACAATTSRCGWMTRAEC
jgi:hypothetical protein